MTLAVVVVAVVAGFGALLLLANLRVLREYQRAVVFRLGRLRPLAGRGWSRSYHWWTGWSASTCAPSP